MLNFLASIVLEAVCDNVPIVGNVVNSFVDTCSKAQAEADTFNEKELERGYRHASSISFDSLEKELLKRKNDGTRDAYTLGMMQRYKELKK